MGEKVVATMAEVVAKELERPRRTKWGQTVHEAFDGCKKQPSISMFKSVTSQVIDEISLSSYQ
jgi:hypothetical protein